MLRFKASSPTTHIDRRCQKSRDADGSQTCNRIWASAVADSGIPFKPTAYQVRYTQASWLIDAGENPKAVMRWLGQADLRPTARYMHVHDETGSQPPGGSKGCFAAVTQANSVASRDHAQSRAIAAITPLLVTVLADCIPAADNLTCPGTASWMAYCLGGHGSAPGAEVGQHKPPD